MSDERFTVAEWNALPDLKFELLDGELYIGGVSHGCGTHARLILQLVTMPPPDVHREAPAPASAPGKADPVRAVFARSGRSDPRDDALLGEIVRFLVRADKAAFATIYAATKVEQAAMDARLQDTLHAFQREHAKPAKRPWTGEELARVIEWLGGETRVELLNGQLIGVGPTELEAARDAMERGDPPPR